MSPIWSAWQQHLADALGRMRSAIDCKARDVPAKIVEQTALNRALLDHPDRIAPLPDLCNWCRHLGLPKWTPADGYVDPETGSRIAVVHLVDFKSLPVMPIRRRHTGEVVPRRGRYQRP